MRESIHSFLLKTEVSKSITNDNMVVRARGSVPRLTLLVSVFLLLSTFTSSVNAEAKLCALCHDVHPHSMAACYDECETQDEVEQAKLKRCITHVTERYTLSTCLDELSKSKKFSIKKAKFEVVSDALEPVTDFLSDTVNWFSDVVNNQISTRTSNSCRRGKWVHVKGPAKDIAKMALVHSDVPKYHDDDHYWIALGGKITPLKKDHCYFTFSPNATDVSWNSHFPGSCYYPLEAQMCVALSVSCEILGFGGVSESGVATATHVKDLKDVSSFLCNTGSRYVSHFAAELDGDTEKDGFGLDYGHQRSCLLGTYDAWGVYSELQVQMDPIKLSNGMTRIESKQHIPLGHGDSGSPCFTGKQGDYSRKVIAVYSGYTYGVGHLVSTLD